MTVRKRAHNAQIEEYRVALKRALHETGGDVRASARRLGVSREWVRRWVKRLEIDLDEYRTSKTYVVVLDGQFAFEVRAANKRTATAKAVKRLQLRSADLGRVHLAEKCNA